MMKTSEERWSSEHSLHLSSDLKLYVSTSSSLKFIRLRWSKVFINSLLRMDRCLLFKLIILQTHHVESTMKIHWCMWVSWWTFVVHTMAFSLEWPCFCINTKDFKLNNKKQKLKLELQQSKILVLNNLVN